MVRFIDISNWQGDINLPALLPNVDGVVCKATEGATFVDTYCDGWIQQCINAGKPWGFYHFAGDGDPQFEAEWFAINCENYFKHGIPVLDWEGVHDANGNLIFDQPIEWVNKFVQHVHDRTNVWPWIYANPWRFNQGGVNPNCARWVASYPEVSHPTFAQAKSWKCPDADGNVVAWQFCSDGRVSVYDKNLDCSLFYGTEKQWRAYALGDNSETDSGGTDAGADSYVSTLENDEYKVTIERKK
jgi:GH25 family lysozyme M1 (1,4-beta-N-acetylmuramidase)